MLPPWVRMATTCWCGSFCLRSPAARRMYRPTTTTIVRAQRRPLRNNSSGRLRYGRDGQKKDRPRQDAKEQQELPKPPPLTSRSSSKRPSYYTCRHSYETHLMEEILHCYPQAVLSSPYPGLVRVETSLDDSLFDPVYALQVLPHCVIVSAESSKQLAEAVFQNLLKDDNDLEEKLRATKRGTLALHALVPGMCKGQPKPILQRRGQQVGEHLRDRLAKQYAAARKAASVMAPRFLLQVLLLTPTVVAASLTDCHRPDNRTTWPNWYLPAGMAQADLDDDEIPSSAYRKLMEALVCLRKCPRGTVVDLGASPGGWTAALLHLGVKTVLAVDRSPLAHHLMASPKVKFIEGDAFAFVPPPEATWMVSDVIAYRDKMEGLLDTWCGQYKIDVAIVTLKFQGKDQELDYIESCLEIAKNHGYRGRAKHFFNNKNEVTLMLERLGVEDRVTQGLESVPAESATAMYPTILPANNYS